MRDFGQFDVGEDTHARESNGVSIGANCAFAAAGRTAGIVDECDIIGFRQIDRRRRTAIRGELQQIGGRVERVPTRTA